jgi:hypothetical protein
MTSSREQAIKAADWLLGTVKAPTTFWERVACYAAGGIIYAILSLKQGD